MILSQRSSQEGLVPSMPCKFKSDIQPLTRQFFSSLIKLESDLQQQDYTMETLDELTSHYAVRITTINNLRIDRC